MSRNTKFGELNIEMNRLTLSDANVLAPFVAHAMTKMSVGLWDFFLDLKPSDIATAQEMICKYCVDIDSSDKIKNITLLDINNNLKDFLPLLTEFLEYNFGFFSSRFRMRQMLKIGEPTEKEEKNVS